MTTQADRPVPRPEDATNATKGQLSHAPSRRLILKGAALATLAGATDLLYPGTALASRRAFARHGAQTSTEGSVNTLTGPDPGFASGTVTEITSNGVLLTNDLRSRVLVFQPGGLVWKEFPQPYNIIQMYDWVSARGEPQEDGALLARSNWVWVNIGKRTGTITSLSASGVTIRGLNGASRSLDFSPYLEVVDKDTATPQAAGINALSLGSIIGAVGVALPNGGFRATRIWL